MARNNGCSKTKILYEDVCVYSYSTFKLSELGLVGIFISYKYGGGLLIGALNNFQKCFLFNNMGQQMTGHDISIG